MKLLLTSAGIKNDSIRNVLVDLLGKPIAESSALCIPTAGYGHPMGSPGGAWRFITGQSSTPMCELGWKSLGVLELTALPSIGEERWVPWVREADVLLVNGGDALYLCHWMRQSGLADLLPELPETVWVGLSAGSMVMAPCIGEDFVGWKPPTGGDRTLGLVDFALFPHLDHPDLPYNTLAHAEKPTGCATSFTSTAIRFESILHRFSFSRKRRCLNPCPWTSASVERACQGASIENTAR
jgi:dipeptidase E